MRSSLNTTGRAGAGDVQRVRAHALVLPVGDAPLPARACLGRRLGLGHLVATLEGGRQELARAPSVRAVQGDPQQRSGLEAGAQVPRVLG